jgi:hypothetical protein
LSPGISRLPIFFFTASWAISIVISLLNSRSSRPFLISTKSHHPL